MTCIGDEADRAAAEHFPSQDDMDAAMEDFLKQLEQEVTLYTQYIAGQSSQSACACSHSVDAGGSYFRRISP